MDETKFTDQFMAEQRAIIEADGDQRWMVDGGGYGHVIEAANHYPDALDEIERLQELLREALGGAMFASCKYNETGGADPT